MAFGTKRVWVSSKAADIAPDGNSVATEPAAIGATVITESPKFNDIACSLSVNADKAIAFDTLMNTDVVAKIDDYITNTLKVDVTGNTVDYNYNVVEVSRGLLKDDIFLVEASDVFIVRGVLTIAAS